MATAALRFDGVTKEFYAGREAGRVRALDAFSAEIGVGTIVGLLGPNGCGKSTALKCALGLLSPDHGQVRVHGLPAGSVKACHTVGYLPERGGVPSHLTAREALQWWAWVNGTDQQAVATSLEAVGLTAAADRRVASFSKGMRQRLALAQAWLPRPSILLLDEPFSGVDPRGVDRLVEMIMAEKQAGKTILLTSHLLPRVEQICDEVILVDRGRVIVAGTVATVLGGEPVRSRGLDDVFRERLEGNKS